MSETSKRLHTLTDHGVAVWADSIARDWLADGELLRLRDNHAVRGVTSNPTIFEAALQSGSAYDAQLRGLAAAGVDAPTLFERLALEDIRVAAEQLTPVYRSTNGHDGYVSYEVSPDLARDTDATISEAARIFAAADLPNLMIKIPATAEGLPAVRASIAAGINVNVTLIFSIERYLEVIDAYLGGLEDRLAAGGSIDGIASVASFFVSRVDTLLDPILEARAADAGPSGALARERLGTGAIDNAKLAYRAWQARFADERWQALAARGARPQRCLWASTSTKNPAYRDVLYCEELIGEDTVNTMPLATIAAFADHGEIRGHTVVEDLDRALRLWDDLAELGIDERQVGQQLEDEGVEKFATSYASVLASVEAARASALG
jgi:transaldolase